MSVNFTDSYNGLLAKDETLDGDRNWVDQKQEGFEFRQASLTMDAKSRTNLLPGGSAAIPIIRPIGHKENTYFPRIGFETALLDNSVLTMTTQTPRTGPVWVGVDVELTLYYWQQNQAAFEYTSPWTLEIPVSKAVKPLSDWIITRFSSQSYHAHVVGKLLVWANKRLTDFDVKLHFRCGTATPKGQWLVAAFRCETLVHHAKLALPPVEGGELSDVCDQEREAHSGDCAGEDDGFVLVAPSLAVSLMH